MLRLSCLAVLVTSCLLFGERVLRAQQVHVQTPMVQSSDSFHEFYGTHWGFSRFYPNGHFFFDNGGFGGAIPPFGGFNPSNAGHLGFGARGPNSNFFFNFVAGQGSQRSIVGSAPSVTMSNGVPGFMFDGQVRPFVTGIVPVIGDFAPPGVAPSSISGVRPVGPTSPLEQRIARLKAGEGQLTDRSAASENVRVAEKTSSKTLAAPDRSSAEHGDLSLAEIRRRKQADQESNRHAIDILEAKAIAADNEGKTGLARLYYRQAANRATGNRRQELLKKSSE